MRRRSSCRANVLDSPMACGGYRLPLQLQFDSSYFALGSDPLACPATESKKKQKKAHEHEEEEEEQERGGKKEKGGRGGGGGEMKK